MIIRTVGNLNRKFKMGMISTITLLAIFIGGSVNAKTVITVGVIQGPKSVNPFVELTGVYYGIFHMVYDTLCVPAPDGKTIYNLATDISSSADGLTYTIKIRPDAVFSDGKPVTADDVAFTHNYIIKNDIGSYTAYTTPIKEIKAVDTYTVEMKLNEKFNRTWLDQNTFSWVPVLPHHIWSEISKEKAVGTLPLDKLIGSGPLTISEFESDHFTRLTLTKNGKKRFNPAFDEAIIKQYANDSAMLQDFKAGNIDIIKAVPSNSLLMLEKMDNVTLNTVPPLFLSEVIFNSWEKAYTEGRKKHPHPSLKDPQIRYALDWVLDEKLAANIVHGKYAIPGSHYLPSGYNDFCNTSLNVRGYDIEKAKKILADGGYRDTDDDAILENTDGLPLEFDVWVPATASHKIDLAGIWARAAKKVGIKLNVSSMDTDTLWSKISPNGNYDIALWNWEGSSDPDFLLSVLTSDSAVEDGWSDSGYSNPIYDKLYNQQRVAENYQERRRIIWEMQEILFTDAPYLVYSYYGATDAINTNKATGDIHLADTADGMLTKEFILSLKPVK